jgi:predicted dithiol-disulfide oxidoreductase (DUF899 family)
MSTSTVSNQAAVSHPVVSREEWLEARRILLAKEKALTKSRDVLCAERSALPWVRPNNIYGKGGVVEGNGRYHAPAYNCAIHK